MTPDTQLDSPGLTNLKALRVLAREVRDLAALAKEGSAQEGKLYAELAAPFTGGQMVARRESR
ncbi:MAG: hypothetical protein AB1582_12180 [Pseudomonadota bacterium]